MMRLQNSKVVGRLSTSARWLVILLLATPPLVAWSAPAAPTAEITVDTTADELDGNPGNGSCSLREAITNANNNNGGQADCPAGSGADTITLPAGTYTLTGSAGDDSNLSGDLDIKGTLTINGAGLATTIIQAGTDATDGIDRVLHTWINAIVEINGVTVRYGRTPDGVDGASDDTCSGGDGGGIYVYSGTLTLNDCSVVNNHTGNGGDGCTSPSVTDGAGGSGGGIYVLWGTVELNHTLVVYNETGRGGDGTAGSYGRRGGDGGGIYLNQADAVVRSSSVDRNRTGDGGRGGSATSGDAGNGASSGKGGGICDEYGTLTLIDSRVSANTTGAGGDGGDASAGNAGNGGNGSDGAGVYAIGTSGLSTAADVAGSRITGNDTGPGGSGGSGTSSDGADGFRGSGGGLYAYYYVTVSLSDTTIGDNTALVGAGIGSLTHVDMTLDGCTISGNIADVSGGGIHNGSTATLALANSTLSANRAYEDGGGIFRGGGDLTLNHVTITDNTADLDNNGSGNGGGFYTASAFTMLNAIVADNIDKGGEDPDCYGPVTSQDYNLLGIGNSIHCAFTSQAHDLVGTDADPFEPYLEPDGLADHGGPTLTHALKPTSPAVDQIPAGVNGCVFGTRDQRGVVRVPACDIGAYEIDRAEHVYLPLVLKNW